jgi:hypothetical protein
MIKDLFLYTVGRYRQLACVTRIFSFFSSLQYEKMKTVATEIVLLHLYVTFYADSENPTFEIGCHLTSCRKSKFSMFLGRMTKSQRYDVQ